MWRDYIDQIEKEQIEYGEMLNEGVQDEEGLFEIVKSRLGVSLPVPYIEFLKKTNGIEYNGYILYGVDEEYLSNRPCAPIYGIIDRNNIYWENAWYKDCLFLGESNIGWYVFIFSSEEYAELDKPSGQLLRKFESGEQMIEAALREALV